MYQLRLQNGFYIASLGPEYQYTWLRDNFYCSIPELWNNPEYYIQTYQTWLDYYKDIEGRYTKFSSIINKQIVDHTYEFPHVKLNIDLTELSITITSLLNGNSFLIINDILFEYDSSSLWYKYWYIFSFLCSIFTK